MLWAGVLAFEAVEEFGFLKADAFVDANSAGVVLNDFELALLDAFGFEVWEGVGVELIDKLLATMGWEDAGAGVEGGEEAIAMIDAGHHEGD